VSGVIWAPGGLNIVELETTEAIVEAIAYAIANPVAAGLVARASDWPGVTAAVTDIGERVLSASRPDYYFTGAQWNEHERASVSLALPTCLAELGKGRAHAWLADELQAQESLARAEVKADGWSVMGPIAAAHASPYRHAKSWKELGKLVPHIKAGRGQMQARLAAIARLKAFRAAHREAKAKWIAGDRDVVFPAGTYWMKVHHRTTTAAFT
jgi:putative transposase